MPNVALGSIRWAALLDKRSLRFAASYFLLEFVERRQCELLLSIWQKKATGRSGRLAGIALSAGS
jgi:hypothetical protein